MKTESLAVRLARAAGKAKHAARMFLYVREQGANKAEQERFQAAFLAAMNEFAPLWRQWKARH